MPKCVFIDNGITVGPDGLVRPCCHIQYNDDWLVHISDFDWENSFPDLKIKMENGWAEECNACRLDEIKNGNSPRTRYEQFAIEGSSKTIFDLKITNTCNLSCRMCTPSQSSTWDKIIKANPDVDLEKHSDRLHPVEKGRSWHSDNLDTIKERFSNVKRLKFTGGEPFLVKQTKQICLNTIDTGASKDTALYFITNGQVFLEDDWFDIFKNFKTVDIDISVDGIGSRYEYIRPGSKWSGIEEFIDRLKSKKSENVDISVTYLPQTLNAGVYHETAQWAKKIDITIHNETDWQLMEPYYMNYSSLNPKLREKLGITTDIPYVEENFKKLVDFMKDLDRIYGTDMRQECPELFDE